MRLMIRLGAWVLKILLAFALTRVLTNISKSLTILCFEIQNWVQKYSSLKDVCLESAAKVIYVLTLGQLKPYMFSNYSRLWKPNWNNK